MSERKHLSSSFRWLRYVIIIIICTLIYQFAFWDKEFGIKDIVVLLILITIASWTFFISDKMYSADFDDKFLYIKKSNIDTTISLLNVQSIKKKFSIKTMRKTYLWRVSYLDEYRKSQSFYFWAPKDDFQLEYFIKVLRNENNSASILL